MEEENIVNINYETILKVMGIFSINMIIIIIFYLGVCCMSTGQRCLWINLQYYNGRGITLLVYLDLKIMYYDFSWFMKLCHWDNEMPQLKIGNSDLFN